MQRVLIAMFIIAVIAMVGVTANRPGLADPAGSGTFTDSRDGRNYKWIKIGNQVWMAENLAYLPSVYPSSCDIETPLKYYVTGYCEGYKKGCTVNDAKASPNYTLYGVLYDREAAQTACPSGWHLPSDAEWTILRNHLGGEIGAGGKMKEAGSSHWRIPNEGSNNSSGFTALPNGYRSSTGSFTQQGSKAWFWSETSAGPAASNYWFVEYYHDYLSVSKISGNCGLSVRCIRN